MSDDDVMTLPPKDKAGLALEKVFHPGQNLGAVQPAPNAPHISGPDLILPPAEKLAAEEWRPVRMLKHYRPVGDFQIAREDETGEVLEWRDRPELTEESNPGLEWQVKEGWLVHIRKTEAQTIVRAGIAERADPFN